MRSAAILAALCLGLSACQTTPTVYAEAASPGAPGYSQIAIEPDRWRVTFRGGPNADIRAVNDMALRRAADLTLNQGYDWFQVTDSYGDGAPRASVGGGDLEYGSRSGFAFGAGIGFTLGGPEVSRTLEIVMGRGAPPREAGVYDARQVHRAFGRPV